MNKRIGKKHCATFSLLICVATSALAQTVVPEEFNVCTESGVALMFFNGVQNTPSDANRSMLELRRIHKDQTDDGRNIRYEVLYNYSAGFEDFVETFEQRLLEQEGLLEGRFELFFEALDGDGPWWSQIVATASTSAEILSGFVDWYQAAIIRNLTTLLANPPTAVNSAEHRTRIDNRVLEGKSLMFVAHSQGNLFVNAAYDYAIGIAPQDSVKVVHIAPASPTLNGGHTLADKDLVINGLRLVGSVPDITDTIPGYLLRPAGRNGQTDIKGHGLVEIYINPALTVSSRVKQQINSALNVLVAPTTAQATTGFFTATLTWDGTGDVDLHTYEPGGRHVYYAAKQGAVGYLDVDNTIADGPEHYYASCDSRALQTGIYTISVANYNRAEGRNATVQIATWNDGVLGTETKQMGAVTGDVPAYQYFEVEVTQDDDTGAYKAALVQ